MFESIKNHIPEIHKEGYVFILIFTFITFLMFAISNTLGWIGVIMTIWCVYFFRDPERITPVTDGIIISPADGLIQTITTSVPPPELEMEAKEMIRISIFLNVFNVHVNRMPVDGVVEKAHYHPGKFFNASLDKASIYNERQSLLIKTDDEKEVAVVQIAGLIARRIVCDAKENDIAKAGERFGIIRFGSRVDVYLPQGTSIIVSEGQTAIGGETVLGNLKSLQNNDINWRKS